MTASIRVFYLLRVALVWQQLSSLEVSAARFGGQSQKNTLTANGKKATVSAAPPCSIPCLSDLVQFQTLLLQLLKSFTKHLVISFLSALPMWTFWYLLSEEKKKLLNPTR